MGTEDGKLHVIFLPFYAPSHMIPLVHTARLFAARGVHATIITTPYNALLFQSSVDRDITSGHPISVQALKFPSSQVGLPEGIENFNAVTSPEMTSKIYHAVMLLQQPMEKLIRDLSPDCIFSDMFFPWTVDLAEELKIPRLLFYPSSFFFHSVVHSLKLHSPQDKVQSDTETFLVPGLPDKIQMKRSQLAEHVKSKTRYGELIKVIDESGARSHGLVHNACYELEPAYADYYRNVKGTKIWHIGPLFQFCKDDLKSNVGVIEQNNCLSWLDTQRPNSVLYVCFGSMVRFSDAQLIEIALALEASDQAFVWVVRKEERMKENERDCWLPKGFEERMVKSNKGMLVRGWAPQLKILDHPATSGFMTHCGWNSVLEAVTAGVPLVTWPLYAEQFYNEKHIELLGVGVGVGSDVWNSGFEITGPVIAKQKIEEAVRFLMGGSEEAEKIRGKAKELAVKAKRAVEEGGSSYNDLTAVIEEIKSCAFEKREKEN